MSEKNEDNVIDIDEAKQSGAEKFKKVDQVYSKDYDGPVVVDFDNGLLVGGKPCMRMVSAVNHLLKQGAEVHVAAIPGDYHIEIAMKKCQELLIGAVKIVDAMDCEEHWSTKAVQFNGQGLRIDGANINGAQITVQIQVDNDGISVFIPEPKITLVHEQVVSLGMFLSQTLTQAIQTMNKSGPDTLVVAPEDVQDAAIGKKTDPGGEG